MSAAARIVSLCAVLVTAGTVTAAPLSAKRDVRKNVSQRDPPSEAFERVGPIRASTHGRERVRNHRPDSVHTGHRPSAHIPDQSHRDALTEFERMSFPEHSTGVTSHILEAPPAAWMRALQLPDLSVRWHAKTVAYLEFFKNDPRGQAMMRAWLKRLGRYEHVIQPILRELGVPGDLVYVALAESGFNPRVRSSVGAAGMWQFMTTTGQVYGLEQDYWVDQRLDVEKSTYAAAAYLKDLRARFGSWELALAAYNGGYGLVNTAVERHNTNNFWTLSEMESGLPHATTTYVPKIIAAAIVGRNREAFGLTTQVVQPLPPLDVVEVGVPPATTLARVAKLLDDDLELLREINAPLIRGRTPPGRGTFPIRIVRAKLSTFERQSHRLSDARDESIHVVRHGDTLARIAEQYRTNEGKLRSLNGLEDSAELGGGLVIVVPRTLARDEQTPIAMSAQPPPLAAVPRVDLRADQRRVFFVTTRATTPHTLAHTLSIPWDHIVAWNDLDPQARLQPDLVLQILVPKAYDPSEHGVLTFEQHEVEYLIRGSREHIEASLRRRELERRGYRVRKGDSVQSVAKRFKLSDGDIARINGFDRNKTLDAGELLVVYVPRGRTRGTVEAPDPTRKNNEPSVPLALGRTERGDETDLANVTVAPEHERRSASTGETSRIPGQQGWRRRSFIGNNAVPARGGRDARHSSAAAPRQARP